MMSDDKLALMRAHRNNIRRYRRLLETELTDLERRFIEQRLAEERSRFEGLTLKIPDGVLATCGGLASGPPKIFQGSP